MRTSLIETPTHTVGGTAQAEEEEATTATEGDGGAALPHGAAYHGPRTRAGAQLMMTVLVSLMFSVKYSRNWILSRRTFARAVQGDCGGRIPWLG